LVHVDGSPNTGWLVYQGDQVSEVVQSQSVYTDVAYDDGTDRPAMEYIHTLPSDEWRAEVIDPMGNLAGTVNLDSIGVPHTWDAWGRNTSTTWDGMDALGWKGLQPETGTGLIYMRARWYDPALGSECRTRGTRGEGTRARHGTEWMPWAGRACSRRPGPVLSTCVPGGTTRRS